MSEDIKNTEHGQEDAVDEQLVALLQELDARIEQLEERVGKIEEDASNPEIVTSYKDRRARKQK